MRFGTKPRSAPIAVGEQAPDFTLRRTFDRDHRLSQTLAAGPAMVLFYVFDFGHY